MATPNYNTGSGTSTANGVGGGMASLTGDTRFLARAPGAPIARPVVGAPDPNNYTAPTNRPVVGAPQRTDFGPGPDKTDLINARNDATKFRQGFNDPTKTSAFASLMGLAQEGTASTQGEAMRAARDAESRAGYAGGFNQAAKQSARDRMSAVASAGFEGAKTIRDQEMQGYNTAEGAVTSTSNAVNAAQTEINTAFGNALNSSHQAQGNLDLGFSDLVQKNQLSYADAAASAKQLQAQLDQAYNGSLIDNAKYTQMQNSLAAEWARTQAQLAEQKREFDINQGNQQQSRSDTLNELAKQRTSSGIDPMTGRRYGGANPAPGGMGSLF